MADSHTIDELPTPEDTLWGVVQEGGSSGERYLYCFDTEEELEAFEDSCAGAAYRVSEPFEVPAGLLEHPDFWSFVDDLMKAATEFT